ncbi:hypothetical protein HZC31_07085 [Candidatus Woesearchaeota archaeon]|nr:hypothetical protein [Candidatus Woesearchaeota archaeon]
MIISTKQWDWDNWVWNKEYKGSLAQATKTAVHVDKVYTNSIDIVAVYKGRDQYYVQSFDQSTLAQSCSLLGVTHPNELEGKTLDAYITETEIVAMRKQKEIPAQGESWNGVL